MLSNDSCPEPEKATTTVPQEPEKRLPGWERPSLPEGYEFNDESAFTPINSRMGVMVTTQGDIWTTYLAFDSIREAYAVHQFLKMNELATYATIRSPGKWLACKTELKIWGLTDECFNRFADSTSKLEAEQRQQRGQ